MSPSGTASPTASEGQPDRGSATRLSVRIGDILATGDLDHDGVDDAAVTLIVDPGGSGTFIYLTAVLNEVQGPRAVASTLLGDRVAVKSIAIQDDTIVVRLLEHGPGEPLASVPTFPIDRIFTLQNGQLVPQE
jgi:hypothetical protein